MGEWDDSSVEKCDIFYFLARYAGMTVMHPGGLKATHKLAESCFINTNSKVLDLACGKGTSAIYLAKKYGCEVIGLDIDVGLISFAKKLARKNGVQDKVSFVVGNALAIPFSDNQFDAVISQSMLILIKDQKKVITEAVRVAREGGSCGWVELSWKKEPTEEFLDTLSNVICAYCMLNAYTFAGWKKLFEDAGVTKLKVIERSMNIKKMGHLLGDEGKINSLKIILKCITDARVRKRMNLLIQTFDQFSEIFGYGIYTVKKYG